MPSRQVSAQPFASNRSSITAVGSWRSTDSREGDQASYGARSLDSRGRPIGRCCNAPLTGLWSKMKDDLPPLKTALLIIAHSRGESAPQRDQTAMPGLQVRSRFKRLASADGLTRARILSATWLRIEPCNY